MPRGPRQLDGQRVGEALQRAIPGAVSHIREDWVEVNSDRITEVTRWLHDSEEFDAAQLSNLTAVDRYTYFEVVYFLQSMDLNHQIELKAIVEDHENPVLPSVYPVYKGALLQEREVYDLMGIRFDGHPDLRRMFLWEGYPAYPLRKDFMNLGDVTPGLRRFPFENKAAPDRLLNQENLAPLDPQEELHAYRSRSAAEPEEQ